MTDLFKRLNQPMDARGMRGVLSRGKPVYRGGFSGPNKRKSKAPQFDLQKVARERLANANRKRV